MSIKLNIDKTVSGDCEGKIIEAKGKTIGECLAYAVNQQPVIKKALFDENGNLRFGNLVRVNGEFITTNPLDRQVKDGDEVGIINLSGG